MPPPRIIEHPMDVTVPGRGTAVFVCIGEGYGFINASWVRGKGNSKRPPPLRSTVTTMATLDNITSILTIPDVNDNMAKLYKCRYSNSEGEAYSDTGKLILKSKCYYIAFSVIVINYIWCCYYITFVTHIW